MRSILSMLIFFSHLLYTEYFLTIHTSNFAKKNFVDKFIIPLPPLFNTDLVRSWITCKTRDSFNIWETSIFCWQKRKLVQHTRNKQEQLNLQDKMTWSLRYRNDCCTSSHNSSLRCKIDTEEKTSSRQKVLASVPCKQASGYLFSFRRTSNQWN